MTEAAATWLWRRLAARLCDTVCIAAAMGLAMLVIVAGAVVAGGGPRESATGIFLLAALPLLGLPTVLTVWFVYDCVLPRYSGQTLGKRLAGLCVVEYGSGSLASPGIDRLAARWMTLQLPAAALSVAGLLEWPTGDRRQMLVGGAWLFAVAAPAMLSQSRRGAHDRLSDTMVVRVSTLPPGHPALAGFRSTWRQASSEASK